MGTSVMTRGLSGSRALLNRVLRYANLRLDTLTSERARGRRLELLAREGHFIKPVYGQLRQEFGGEVNKLFAVVKVQQDLVAKFRAPHLNDVGYTFDNEYFRSPDAELLYAMMSVCAPRRVVEVGSGNSTKLMRQAIIDFGLETRIISIDPQPRLEVGLIADEVHRDVVENLDPSLIASWLAPNDILFIDSSHLIDIGNDVPFLYFKVLPQLVSGVVVHVHDIFLPYEYPKEWVVFNRWQFNEQAILNAIIQWSDGFKILWPGHFLQRTHPLFATYLPNAGDYLAQSFWMRKQ